jgi:D-3-phosphoglycerate dehydrogenase
MKLKIIVANSIPKEGLRTLEDKFNLVYPSNDAFSDVELFALLPDAEALITTFLRPINAELMNAAPKLKIIANYGVGFNNIQVDEATKRKIVVTNTPNSVTEPTAEMSLALMLSLMRNVTKTDKLIRANNVEWGLMKNLGSTLQNKTLGIIGMGRIGQSTAKKAMAFGMKIVYFSRTPLSDEKEKELCATRLEFDQLLAMADVVSIHLPLNEKTRHFINEDALAKMKNGAFIINTARGPIIDELALVNSLKSGHISGAGIDVFEYEPKITDELLGFDNVVLTPHIGTGTMETRIATSAEVADNILAFFGGKTPPNQINPF